MAQNCVPGTVYQDELGQYNYCPAEAGQYGLDYESSWLEQAEERGSSPLWDIMENQSQFTSLFNMADVYKKLPKHEAAEFGLEQELLGAELGMLGTEAGIAERTAAEMLRGGSMESGERLASSGFAGGGAYGKAVAKGRERTLRDYGQSMKDISLKGAGIRTGYEEDVADIRYDYGESVADYMAMFYSLDPSTAAYAAGDDEGCDPGEVWIGGSGPGSCVTPETFQAMIGDL